MDSFNFLDAATPRMYCTGCSEFVSVVKQLPCCQGDLCLGCFSVLQLSNANAPNASTFCCLICRKFTNLSALVAVKAYTHTRPSLTKSMKDLLAGIMKQTPAKTTVSNASGLNRPPIKGSHFDIPATSISYPPPVLMQTVEVDEVVNKRPVHAFSKGRSRHLPLRLLLRNKVEYLHGEYSDSVSLVRI